MVVVMMMKKSHRASQDDPFLLHTLFDHDQTQLLGRKRPKNHFHDATHLVYTIKDETKQSLKTKKSKFFSSTSLWYVESIYFWMLNYKL